jgi:hypothetical protein
MKPRGDCMIGMSRAVKNGKTVGFGFIQIVESGDGAIQYVAHPSGQNEATFRLTRLDGKTAVFENPQHDYPQRVMYSPVSADSLFARIEGTIDGNKKASDFPYRRLKCA